MATDLLHVFLWFGHEVNDHIYSIRHLDVFSTSEEKFAYCQGGNTQGAKYPLDLLCAGGPKPLFCANFRRLILVIEAS
jgi:hypothetical protein